MRTAPIRAQYKAEIRREILHVARQIFVHESYDSFSIRKAAAKLGYSPAAIYRHFKTKDEIFACLVDESFSALVRASESVQEIEKEDPVDRLKRGMWAYVNFGIKNPDHYRFAFLLKRQSKPQPYKPSAAYDGLRRRCQASIDAGRFQAEDPDLIAQTLWSAAHGITSLLIQRPKFPWVDRKRLVQKVIDGAVEQFRIGSHTEVKA